MSSVQKANDAVNSHEFWPPLLGLSAQEVFSIMLNSELVVPGEPFSCGGLSVTSMVGLAGSLCGLVSLRCEEKAATLIASKMLGVEIAMQSQEVFDAMGEVCNMVAGNFKNKISGLGDSCQLSLPTVITGEDYSFRAIAEDFTIERRFLFEGLPLVISLKINS
jgi:chemotaxis protein CheX